MSTVTLDYGVDVLTGLQALPAQSVHCVVTSPPYWGLRSYLPASHPHKGAELGLEKIPDCLGWATGQPCGQCYVCHLVAVFREVWRVLRTDGTVWLNLGDSYASGKGTCFNPGGGPKSYVQEKEQYPLDRGNASTLRAAGLKPKDLVLIPPRVALALQAAGWWVRNAAIWAKTAPMPESATDRLTTSYEHVYLLAKAKTYYFDIVAIAEPSVSGHSSGNGYQRDERQSYRDANGARGSDTPWTPQPTRQRRDVITLGPDPYKAAHFATMPRALARLGILAGTSAAGCCPQCGKPWVRVVAKTDVVDPAAKGSRFDVGKTGTNGNGRTQAGARTLNQSLGWVPGCQCTNPAAPASVQPIAYPPVPCLVLDLFSGSGTTVAAAKACGRDGHGIDLSAAYLPLAEDRLAAVTAPLIPVGYEIDLSRGEVAARIEQQSELFT